MTLELFPPSSLPTLLWAPAAVFCFSLLCNSPSHPVRGPSPALVTPLKVLGGCSEVFLQPSPGSVSVRTSPSPLACLHRRGAPASDHLHDPQTCSPRAKRAAALVTSAQDVSEWRRQEGTEGREE